MGGNKNGAVSGAAVFVMVLALAQFNDRVAFLARA